MIFLIPCGAGKAIVATSSCILTTTPSPKTVCVTLSPLDKYVFCVLDDVDVDYCSTFCCLISFKNLDA